MSMFVVFLFLFVEPINPIGDWHFGDGSIGEWRHMGTVRRCCEAGACRRKYTANLVPSIGFEFLCFGTSRSTKFSIFNFSQVSRRSWVHNLLLLHRIGLLSVEMVSDTCMRMVEFSHKKSNHYLICIDDFQGLTLTIGGNDSRIG